MAIQSDDEKPRWRILTPDELRAELDAVWPPGVTRPISAAVSSDGRRWLYSRTELQLRKGANDAS